MSTSDDALRRIDALIQVAMRLAATAPSGRIALAKLASALEPEWIPRPWGDAIWSELESARAAALEPLAFRTVEGLLRDAWGAKVSSELDALEAEPVAVTPSSQVHRGEREGAPVAVKVLRPGLAASVRQDLTLLEGLLSPLGAAFPGLDTQAILRETRERVLDELDLEHAAGLQRRFHRALRNHPGLFVPAPVTALSHAGVLVSEWVDGVPLIDAPEATRNAAAAHLIAFVMGGLRAALISADLDPGDVLIQADGRVAIVDLSSAATVDAGRVEFAVALVEAFIAGDGTALGAALERLGLLPASRGPVALAVVEDALGELGGPQATRLDSAAVIAARDRLFRQPDALELVIAGTLPPEELWPGRAIAQLFGTVARVGATGVWRDLVLGALRDGWEGR